MVKKMGQNPFEQKHKIDQLFKQRECLPKALSKIARCLKISRIILSYPLADCFEFRACLAGRCLFMQPKYKQILNKAQQRVRKNN